MTLPCQPVVNLRLGLGAGWGDPLVLGDPLNGILGTNVLGTSSVQVVDITNLTTNISIRRGRDRVFEQYSPGSATIRFYDTTGDWNPNNAASPYYPQILPMRQVQISTEYLGVPYYLFTGFIQSWDWQWDYVNSIAWVTIVAQDAFRLFNLANITTVTGAGTGDLPGERVNQILDQIGWPQSLRDIDNGNIECENDNGTLRTALNAIQTAEITELGHFFMGPDGFAVFKSREAISLQAAGTPTDFADDGTGIKYQTLDIALDDTELSNIVTVTRDGGSAQTVSDQDSIDEYFARSYNQSGLIMRTNAEALSRATAILNYRKQVRLRVDEIGLDISSVSDRVVPALSLTFGDPIYVRRTEPGGSSIDVRLTVQGVSHDITPGTWFTKFDTAYPLSVAFILGSAEFGILGTSTL